MDSLVVQHQELTKHYELQMEIFNNAVCTLGINFIIIQLPLFGCWLWYSLYETFARRKEKPQMKHMFTCQTNQDDKQSH